MGAELSALGRGIKEGRRRQVLSGLACFHLVHITTFFPGGNPKTAQLGLQGSCEGCLSFYAVASSLFFNFPFYSLFLFYISPLPYLLSPFSVFY